MSRSERVVFYFLNLRTRTVCMSGNGKFLSNVCNVRGLIEHPLPYTPAS